MWPTLEFMVFATILGLAARRLVSWKLCAGMWLAVLAVSGFLRSYLAEPSELAVTLGIQVGLGCLTFFLLDVFEEGRLFWLTLLGGGVAMMFVR